MVNTIFALDIGTRTVVGVLARGSADRDLLEIIDMEVMTQRRACLTGRYTISPR